MPMKMTCGECGAVAGTYFVLGLISIYVTIPYWFFFLMTGTWFLIGFIAGLYEVRNKA